MPVPASSTSQWAVPATAEQVAVLRRAVTAYAEQVGVPADRLAGVRLAVSEAVTNAILHAYRDREPGQIRVQAELVEDDRCLQIVVEDDGFGPLPRPDSPGLGLGLPTIASVADGIDLAAGRGAGARLQMRFRLDGPGAGA